MCGDGSVLKFKTFKQNHKTLTPALSRKQAREPDRFPLPLGEG